MPRTRARDLGLVFGRLDPGPQNAITDVPGVGVGHATVVKGAGVRTGVTVITPHDGDPGVEPVFAASHVLNGDGEMTGLTWLNDSGCLATPIAFTNTCSVGIVRDAMIKIHTQRGVRDGNALWSLPVVGETWDGCLNDIQGQHVTHAHVEEAFKNVRTGRVAEGCVGGGTGMICHGFKGGIGTSSRRTKEGWTVGALVQANYGQRELLRIDGVPIGRAIPATEIPLPWTPPPEQGSGSILVVLATDAPLLPHQLRRLAQRATIGIARMGGLGENTSGDIFLAFATAHRGKALMHGGATARSLLDALPNDVMSGFFEAAADATEESIVNALCAAETMTGFAGHKAEAIPLDRLKAVLRAGR